MLSSPPPAQQPSSTILTSAGGILALLEEPEAALKVLALTRLNSLVEIFWSEISESLPKIEVLYEDDGFDAREMAALVASKVYFYLGEYDEALNFALGAKSLFDLNSKTEFVETVISHAIDAYIQQRQSHAEINPDLFHIVQQMFERCFRDREFKQAVGIALESRHLDFLEEAVNRSGFELNLIEYVQALALSTVQNLDFRNEVLRLVVRMYEKLQLPDYLAINTCFVHLDDADASGRLLIELISCGDLQKELTAFQLAFDLEDLSTQRYRKRVITILEGVKEKLSQEYEKLYSILTGKVTIQRNLEFLYRHNHADTHILKQTRSVLDARNSAYHSAVTFSNAIMHCGTTSDQFLRENLDWLSRANNWAKFAATAGLGVIHKGQVGQSLALLTPYLPKENGSESVYTEGGALYALGLIHANHGSEVIEKLTGYLHNAKDEVVKHGGCLGLGLAAMATNNEDAFEELKTVLFSDSSVAGEAAGIAMGLVMLGTGNPAALQEMLQYSRETQHEKIIRGLGLGMALVMYGREEHADDMIAQLSEDKDPILRYSAAYTIALAYCGTGNHGAIQRLLHMAVSDVNDDVRRAAVIGLGFLLLRTPKQAPRIVQLLAESYSPHVRYGAALALGVACAGSGYKEAVDILERMTKDTVDYVRQAAFVALALVLIQHSDHTSPKTSAIRAMLARVVEDKHEYLLSKLGATYAQGIIDAGGRNVTVALRTRSGRLNPSAVVGLAVFAQFWFWFPLTHFLSLAMTPTAVICLNRELQVPALWLKSSGPLSWYAYPVASKPPAEKEVGKIATAVLSLTARAKARAKKQGKTIKMDLDDGMKTPPLTFVPMEVEEKPQTGLENMSRVIPPQLSHIQLDEQSRYVLVRKGLQLGINIVHDTTPEVEEALLTLGLPTVHAAEDNDPEVVEPPPPFEFPFNDSVTMAE